MPSSACKKKKKGKMQPYINSNTHMPMQRDFVTRKSFDFFTLGCICSPYGVTYEVFFFRFFFFFNDTATTEIYTLSLHDALPISDDCATSGPASSRRRSASSSSP